MYMHRAPVCPSV